MESHPNTFCNDGGSKKELYSTTITGTTRSDYYCCLSASLDGEHCSLSETFQQESNIPSCSVITDCKSHHGLNIQLDLKSTATAKSHHPPLPHQKVSFLKLLLYKSWVFFTRVSTLPTPVSVVIVRQPLTYLNIVLSTLIFAVTSWETRNVCVCQTKSKQEVVHHSASGIKVMMDSAGLNLTVRRKMCSWLCDKAQVAFWNLTFMETFF